MEFRLLLEFGSVMESWAFLGFRRHWQHVYSAISRERRTALRCKEWCFDVSTSFFPNKVFCLIRDITPLQFRLRMFQKSRKHPHLMTLQLVFTYFHGWIFQLPWFLGHLKTCMVSQSRLCVGDRQSLWRSEWQNERNGWSCLQPSCM